MTRILPPRHIVWGTDTVDLGDSFQRWWYICQVLLHGRAEDIRSLDLDELEAWLDHLGFPSHLYSLWKTYLERRRAEG